MTLNLPRPIACYFEAQNTPDIEAVAACFAPDAHVRDESASHIGIDAVRAWASAARSKYSFEAQPRRLSRRDGAIVVTAHLTGDFPGAPVDLSYRFALRGERIQDLEITPVDSAAAPPVGRRK